MGHRGPWAEMKQAAAERGDEAAAQQMLARFPGVCGQCGATVGVNDLIRWDRGARKIIQCLDCGLSMCGRLKIELRGRDVDQGPNQRRRERAARLAAAEASVATWDRAYTAAQTDARRGTVAGILERRRVELDEAQRDVQPRRGEVAWSFPSARDLELAREAHAREAARRAQIEAEERAEDLRRIGDEWEAESMREEASAALEGLL